MVERRPETFAACLDEVARDLVQESVLPAHESAQAQLEACEILLADREGERVRAAHQVRHLTPKGHRTDSRAPTPLFRGTVIFPPWFNSVFAIRPARGRLAARFRLDRSRP